MRRSSRCNERRTNDCFDGINLFKRTSDERKKWLLSRQFLWRFNLTFASIGLFNLVLDEEHTYYRDLWISKEMKRWRSKTVFKGWSLHLNGILLGTFQWNYIRPIWKGNLCGINTFHMDTFFELLQFDNDKLFVFFWWRIPKSVTKIQTCVIHSRIRHFNVTEESRGVHVSMINSCRL